MCRNIRPLYNFSPPATNAEVRDAALQFVRKVSGFNKPSKANEPAFNRAIDEVSASIQQMLDSLVTNAAPRDRDTEATKGRARLRERTTRPTPTLITRTPDSGDGEHGQHEWQELCWQTIPGQRQISIDGSGPRVIIDGRRWDGARRFIVDPHRQTTLPLRDAPPPVARHHGS